MPPFPDLARLVRAAADTPLAPSLEHKLRLHALDAAAAVVAGANTPEGRALLAHGLPNPTTAGAPPEPTVAALAAAARLTEADDIDRTASITAGAAVVPAAMILGEALAAPDEAILRAALAGYEAMLRVGRAVGGAYLVYRGVWTSLLAVSAGVAAVDGVLRDLAPENLAAALALAVALAPRTSPAAPARWSAFAEAARLGVAAARAAGAGLADGAEGAARLDPEAAETAFSRLVASAPAPLFAEVSLKPYPAAKQTVAGVEAVHRLARRLGLPPEDLTVEVAVPAVYARMVDHGAFPGQRTSSLTSLPYQAALRLVAPERLYDPVRRKVADGVVARLTERIRVVADPDLEGLYPAVWPARAEVRLSDGRCEAERVTVAPGDPEAPLGDGEVLDKWRRTLRFVVDADRTEAFLATAAAFLSKASGVRDLLRAVRLCLPGADGGL